MEIQTTYCKSFSLFNRIKYWIDANCANWHDWMHENSACACMLFNGFVFHRSNGTKFLVECGLLRPFYSCFARCVSNTWMNERKKAYLYSSITKRKRRQTCLWSKQNTMIHRATWTVVHSFRTSICDTCDTVTLITEPNIIECHWGISWASIRKMLLV